MTTRRLFALLTMSALAGAGWPRRASAQLTPAPSGAGPAAPPWNRHLTPRTLDADGIEELFERVARNGGIAHLPGGNYRINRTIRLVGLGSIRVEGESVGAFSTLRPGGFRAVPTRLLWTGEPGGTMFHLDGSVGQSFSHMQFHGGGTPDRRGRAGRLFLLTSRPGWGTCCQRFTRVLFTEAEVAIQCGLEEMEFNNADIIHDEVSFTGVDVGLRTLNHQSLNHHFRSLGIFGVGTAFDMQRGGNVNVEAFAAGTFDLLLRVGNGGWNAGTFRFAAGRPEMNGLTRRHARLVEAMPADTCRVVFEATQESEGPLDQSLPDNSADPAFKVGRGASVILRDHFHYRPAVECTGGVFRDIDGRWNPEALQQLAAAPAARPGVAAQAGRIEVVSPTTSDAVPLEPIPR